LQSAKSALLQELNTAQVKSSALVAQLELEPQLLEQRVSLEEQLSNLEHKLQVIIITMDLLNAANDNITSVYLNPLLNSINNYFELVRDSGIDKFVIDANFALKVEVDGKVLDADYFSKGYKDLFDLVFRLALADVLFDGELPFIVLDDPFINLDNNNFNLVSKVLKQVAHKHQLLYFTCHPSRAI